jgi:hypothetical protein
MDAPRDRKKPAAATERSDGRATSPSQAAVEALSRLFAVASIYAPTHQRVAALSAPTIEALRSACSSTGHLVLDLRDGAIHVGADALAEKGSTVQRLRQDLEALGITRVELSEGTTAEDLLALGRLLRTKSQRRGNATFEQADLGGLPETIKAFTQDFGRPTFDESEDPTAAVRLPADLLAGLPSDALRAPSAAGSGKSTRARRASPHPTLTEQEIRAVVAGSVRRVRDLPPGAHVPAPFAAFTSRSAGDALLGDRPAETRQEMQRALAEAVERTVARSTGGGPATANPERILAEAAKTLPRILPGMDLAPVLDSLKEAIDVHMRDAFRREASVVSPQDTVRSRESEDHELSLEALEEQLDVVGDRGPDVELEDDPHSRAAEHLGILLFVLGDEPTAAVLAGLGPRLSRALAAPFEAGEGDVIAGWIRDRSHHWTDEQIDQRLPALLEPLRARGAAVVERTLLDAVRLGDARTLQALWPHVAAELLGGLGEEPDESGASALELEAQETLGSLPAESRRAALGRLAALPVVARGAVSRSLLSPPREALYPLYSLLLEFREAPAVGAEVVEAFFRYPPDVPAMAALLVLRPQEERTRAFIGRFLRERTSSGETAGLKKLAAQIIISDLQALPRRRRTEDLVVKAIGSLRLLPCREVAQFVAEVKESRVLGILQAWPPPARQAAAALDAILRAAASTDVAGDPAEPVADAVADAASAASSEGPPDASPDASEPNPASSATLDDESRPGGAAA